MADAPASLEECLRDVVALTEMTPSRRFFDLEIAAWKRIQPAIKAESAALRGHSEETMKALLMFVVQWQMNFPLSTSKVLECLEILLQDASWLDAVQLLSADMKAQLKDLSKHSKIIATKLQQLVKEDPVTPARGRSKTSEGDLVFTGEGMQDDPVAAEMGQALFRASFSEANWLEAPRHWAVRPSMKMKGEIDMDLDVSMLENPLDSYGDSYGEPQDPLRLRAKQLQEEWDAIARQRATDKSMGRPSVFSSEDYTQYDLRTCSSSSVTSPYHRSSIAASGSLPSTSSSTAQPATSSLPSKPTWMRTLTPIPSVITQLIPPVSPRAVIQKFKQSGYLAPKDASKKGREAWVSDGAVTECTGCQIKFSMTVRKHHCRECGKIFCGTCTKNRIVYTPGGYAHKPDDGYNEKAHIVCTPCHSRLGQIQFDAMFAPLYFVETRVAA